MSLEARETAAGQHDLRVGELQGGVCAAQHPDRLLAAADLRAAAGGVEVELPDLLVDLDGGDAQRLHASGIELDADLAIYTAAARYLRDAGYAEQTLGDGVVHEPGELLLGQAWWC